MGTITGYEKMPAGSVLHGAYGTKTSYTKTWAPPSLAAQSAWQQYLAGSASPLIGPVPRGATRPSTPSSSAKLFASLGPAQQSFMETSSAFPKALGVSGTAATAFVNSMARATTMRTAGGENKAMVDAEGQLIAAAVKQQDAADHFKESAYPDLQFGQAVRRRAHEAHHLSQRSDDRSEHDPDGSQQPQQLRCRPGGRPPTISRALPATSRPPPTPRTSTPRSPP